MTKIVSLLILVLISASCKSEDRGALTPQELALIFYRIENHNEDAKRYIQELTMQQQSLT